MTRCLTHVELLHRPGERAPAAQVLALLGCEPVDRSGHWFTSFIDPDAPRDWSNNVLYVSEVGAEQWALEQALPPEADAYRKHMRDQPQSSAHFGFRVSSEDELLRLVDRIQAAGASDPQLRGRVAVDGVYRPGDPDANAQTMIQAFVWTDVIASGLLTLGQHIEMQWHLPA